MNESDEPRAPQQPAASAVPEDIRNGVARLSRALGILSWVSGILFLLLLGPLKYGGRWVDSGHLGLLAPLLLLSAPILAVLSVVLGHVARFQLRSTSGESRDRDRANVGLSCGYLLLIVLGLFAAANFERPPHSHRLALCPNNLKQMGLVLRMYSTETPDHYFPELSPEPGKLSIWNDSGGKTPVCPEYLADYTVLFCPATENWRRISRQQAGSEPRNPDPQKYLDESDYMYPGYAIGNERELEAFAAAYKERVARGLRFNEDLVVPAGSGNNGGNTIHRLREGVARFLITDLNNPAADAMAESKIPVLIEPPAHHRPGGGHILYLDGHVEFHKYPGDWPMTERTLYILNSLKALQK